MSRHDFEEAAIFAALVAVAIVLFLIVVAVTHG